MKLQSLFNNQSTSPNKVTNVNTTDQAKVIIDNIGDGVILIDENKLIRLINPAAANLCGWTVEDASGISLDSVVKLLNDKGDILDPAQNPFNQIFREGKSIINNDYILLAKHNQQYPISLHVSPLFDKNQSVYQAIAIINDISREKTNEKQRTDFISTASHEMRTPVAAIEGYLALALNDKVATIDNRARNYLEKAHASTQNLGKLFQDLLTSAKAEDGRLTSHPVIVEMGDFLEQLTSDLKLVAEKKELAVELSSGSATTINATSGSAGGERVVRPLYYVLVDPDRLREVITNLFDNAVKYTAEGKITIGLSGNDQVVQSYIKDTGPGIPQEDLPHLFQKFYRVDNTATRTIGGTGLGLFICRKIIELYNGHIWAESELGKGSTFYINLPRLNAHDVTKYSQMMHDENIIKPTGTFAAA